MLGSEVVMLSETVKLRKDAEGRSGNLKWCIQKSCSCAMFYKDSCYQAGGLGGVGKTGLGDEKPREE